MLLTVQVLRASSNTARNSGVVRAPGRSSDSNANASSSLCGWDQHSTARNSVALSEESSTSLRTVLGSLRLASNFRFSSE